MGQVTFHVERLHGVTGEEFQIPLLERVLISGRSFWFYLSKLFYPHRLGFIYERWHVDTGDVWQYVYPAATVGLLAGLWAVRRRIGKGPFAAMLHFYVSTSMLILIVVLYFTRYSFVSDHWQYFGCMSVIALAAAGIARVLDLIQAGRPYLKPALCAGLVALLGVLTWRQSGMYADSETIWRKTVEKNPDGWIALNNFGMALVQEGRVDEGIAYLERATEISSNDPMVQVM